MATDRRYEHAKHAIQNREITVFRKIFEYVPKTVMAKDLRIRIDRFNILINNVRKFKISQAHQIAKVIGVDRRAIISLILEQYQLDKRAYCRE